MNAPTPSSSERTAKLEGLGCARKRVEDARFTQGKGNYVDDIRLPGMLFGDFVRSPYGHARITRIDKEAALKVPGVVAILTAADLKPLNLHYMPTLAGDVQAVLADEKVLFQAQEVAFVIATDRYAAADAVELVEVDYEALPALVDPFKALDADAPVLREDIKDKTDGRARAAPASEPRLPLGGGRQGGDRAGAGRGRGRGRGADLLPAGPSLPARDLRLRRLDGQGQRQAHGLGDVPGAACGAHRGVADLEHPRAQHPHRLARHRRRLRQQGRRLSGLHLRDRRLDRDRRAGQVDRGPHGEPVTRRPSRATTT